MKIGNKVVVAVSSLSVALSVAYISLFIVEKEIIGEQITNELNEVAYQVSRPAVEGAYNLCLTAQELIQDKNMTGLNLANDIIARSGGITLDGSKKVEWGATNQITKNVDQIELPAMMLGGQPIEKNYTFDKVTPVVDDIMRMSNITCTIFQKMDNNSMLRVATNVKLKNGNRAVGTYIPNTSPVVQTVLRGETFKGKAYVVNKNYITAYQPLKDSSGNIVGIIYVGVPQDEAKTLKESLIKFKIGKTGYIFVVDGSNNKIVVHPKASLEGKSMIGLVKSKGTEFSDNWDKLWIETFAEAKKLSGSNSKTVSYEWTAKNKNGDIVPAHKVASVSHFKAWDWYIVSSTYMMDFHDPIARIDRTLENMVFYFILVGLIVLILSIIGTLIFAQTLSKPILVTTKLLQSIAIGELPKIEVSSRKDEIGEMSRSLKQMGENIQNRVNSATSISRKDLTEYIETNPNDVLGSALKTMSKELNQFITEISTAATEVELEGKHISDSSQSLSESATRQAASLEEINSSVHMVSDQTKVNSENASKANSLVVDAKNSASEGKEHMMAMVEAMSEINSASESVSKVIKVIDDIAFQTNLLALNAAVEAARAGQHGKGFAVVAEEVRSLAGRSAKAAKETAELIEGAVRKASRGSEVADLTSSSLNVILEKITTASDLVIEISTSSGEQANSLSEISTGLTQIDTTTQQNTATAEEVASASVELSVQARTLKSAIGEFKFREGSKVRETFDNKANPKESEPRPTTAPVKSGLPKLAPTAPSVIGDAKEEMVSLDDEDWGKY